jgi:hypothetical protein
MRRPSRIHPYEPHGFQEKARRKSSGVSMLYQGQKRKSLGGGSLFLNADSVVDDEEVFSFMKKGKKLTTIKSKADFLYQKKTTIADISEFRESLHRSIVVKKDPKNIKAKSRVVVPLWDSPNGGINTRCDYMTYWDLNTVVLLFYVSVVTPYEVAFLDSDLNFLFFLNRLVDIFFVFDIVVQFFLPYLDHFGHEVKVLSLIQKRYLKTWFAIDFISIFPFDLVVYLLDIGSSGDSLKILRVLKLFKLIKMLRVLKGLRIVNRWEARVQINYGLLHLVILVIVLIFVCHW